MSITVNEAFIKFNREYINLDPERTKIARASRNWLIEQLMKLPEKEGVDFHKLYDGRHLNFGSFARNTKIRDLDDIDLILCFHAQGASYNTLTHGLKYTIAPHSNPNSLHDLRNEDGTLNSIKLVNKIVSALGEIDQYESSEKHRQQEAATLNLSSYEWTFDIVPAFFTADTEHYLIPDGQGNWKATAPTIDQERVNRINIKHGGKVLQIIRTLKFWNRRGGMTTIPPYLFENIILNYFDNKESITDWIDLSLRDFWGYLINGINYSVPDPKGFQGELNTLSWEERQSISARAKDAYEKGSEAIRRETVEKNQQSAINKWSEIFGKDFE
jgi:hypothetical protein